LYQPTETFGDLPPDVRRALDTLEKHNILDWGDAPETEFFVIRLKDKYAQSALLAYANYASADGDEEYAQDVLGLAQRAGPANPHCKRPD
jgi:hypothetical protein